MLSTFRFGVNLLNWENDNVSILLIYRPFLLNSENDIHGLP